ncbi:penicillin-binding protein 1A [Neptunomonas phycophila]|uniref:penicillin-binding protein 1A n=1 Tax=Neptunomonas phycophila TaxID=1572645 RepID=UPI000948A73D|nr:penicillin-binding protein 1A [Neptunomonas phycophila]
MRVLTWFCRITIIFIVLGSIIGGIAAFALYQHFVPQLPDVETLRDTKFQTPLKVLSSDGKLIAEFGEKKRIPVTYEQIPERFVQALQAAEDSRFFEHSGIDIKGLTRAAVQLVSTGRIQSGGSTITMQVAKNFFLSRDRTFERKFNEILLALKIERSLSKPEIFELYVNKIYLGHRSYGIQSAANVYYGKNIDELNLAQLAMIAGLPKAPSAYNPITNPSRALERRNWILGRMKELAFISESEYEEAANSPVTAKYHTTEIELYAPYIAEMVRGELYEQYGEDLYTDGFTVHTTIDSQKQIFANRAVRDGLLSYVKRHGYRGPEKNHNITDLSNAEITQLLKDELMYTDLEPAIVVAIEDKTTKAIKKDGEEITIEWDGLKWAKPFKSVNAYGYDPKKPEDVVALGDVIRVLYVEDHWELSQVPKVQGAMVAMKPQTGAIEALVGGFSFAYNNFNRATQAYRQPGSNFKPFIYAAALENGYTPASVINDAPIVLDSTNMDNSWRPENSGRSFAGPTRLRVGLYRSRNLVSIRLLRALGIGTAIEYLGRFGFDTTKLPHNLSLSLGSADVTPLELITGYAAFANGGYKVTPNFIKKIEDGYGNTVFEANYPIVCSDCSDEQTTKAPRIMDSRANYLLYTILQDVIRRGTATAARVLKRNDLAGKTGTTNDQKDAWFTGYNRELVATAWVGYDQPSTLGKREYGGTAALPLWINFMRDALKDTPEAPVLKPGGIIQLRIDAATGMRASAGSGNTIYEYFSSDKTPGYGASAGYSGGKSTEDIF